MPGASAKARSNSSSQPVRVRTQSKPPVRDSSIPPSRAPVRNVSRQSFTVSIKGCSYNATESLFPDAKQAKTSHNCVNSSGVKWYSRINGHSLAPLARYSIFIGRIPYFDKSVITKDSNGGWHCRSVPLAVPVFDAAARIVCRRESPVPAGGTVEVCHWLRQCSFRNSSGKCPLRHPVNHRQARILLSRRHVDVVPGRRPFPIPRSVDKALV